MNELSNTTDLHYKYFHNHPFFQLWWNQYIRYECVCNYSCLFSNLLHQNLLKQSHCWKNSFCFWYLCLFPPFICSKKSYLLSWCLRNRAFFSRVFLIIIHLFVVSKNFTNSNVYCETQRKEYDVNFTRAAYRSNCLFWM